MGRRTQTNKVLSVLLGLALVLSNLNVSGLAYALDNDAEPTEAEQLADTGAAETADDEQEAADASDAGSDAQDDAENDAPAATEPEGPAEGGANTDEPAVTDGDQQTTNGEPEATSTRAGPLKAPALRAAQNNVITSIEALLQDGSGPVGDVSQWQVFRLKANFALPDGQVNVGDTTTITLPEKLKFNQTAGFNITDSNGNIVATAVINGSAKTITLTYTDYPANHSDVTGSFYFYVQIDRNKVDGEENIPLDIRVGNTIVHGGDIHFIGIPDPTGRYLSKSGFQTDSANNRSMTFMLMINTVRTTINDAYLEDQVSGAGLTIDPNSFLIRKGTWEVVHGDFMLRDARDVTSQYTINMNADGTGFSIDLGDITPTDGLSVRYNVISSYDLVDGEVLRNDASIRGSQVYTHKASAEGTYYEAGGSAEGYVYSIRIFKQDENAEPLAGATFDVVRVSNGAVVATVTTDGGGEATIRGLLKDTYELVEVDAPSGYVKLSEPVRVTPEDFNSDKVAIKTISNERDSVSIPVTKSWDDDGDRDGARPESVTVRLLADGNDTGKTITLSADNDWSGSFDDLQSTNASGDPITYTVEEVDVPSGYVVSGIEGDVDAGFTVTNAHTPEQVSVAVTKAWVGPERDSVTVSLYADDVDTGKTLTLTAADGWTGSFTGLNKHRDGGTEIVYTVKEAEIENYRSDVSGDAASGFTVTNTNTETLSIPVTKAWEDDGDRDGKRPDSVTVRLLANGNDTGQTLTLSGDSWSGSFNGLARYDDSGNEITYTVEEVDVPSGYVVAGIAGNAADGFTVTNEHEPERTSVPVTKTWVGPVAGPVVVHLLADGNDTGQSLTLSEGNNWTGSFDNLNKYRDGGTEIDYTISEDPVANYVPEITGDAAAGFTITNSNNETVSIPVTKAWDDANNQDGIRPDSITVELYAQGDPTGITRTLTAADGWTASFDGLARYDADGTEIVYTVKETSVPTGYDNAGTEGDASTGFTITNAHTPEETFVPVAKIWVGPERDSVTVHLLADGNDTGKTLTLTAADGWSGVFSSLPKYRDGGIEIVYTISEDPVADYSTDITGEASTGFTITNTNDETIDLEGTKTWDDDENRDGVRPESITIRLLVDGTEVANATVTADDGWAWSFTGLRRYDATDGHEIVYTVTEDAIVNYSTNYDGINVTNTHTPDETSVTVTKAWVDANNQDGIRPDSITVVLVKDGTKTDKTLTLSAENNWVGSFEGLPVYRDGGIEIAWTVEEAKVEGYTSATTGDATTGFVITNTHEPEKTSIDVTKVWDDGNDADGIRPDSITVRLFANGVATNKTLTLSEDNNWSGTFKDLAVKEGGKKITYTVEEVGVPSGYEVEVTGDADSGFDVTNTHEPEKPGPKKPKPNKPNKKKSHKRALVRTGDGTSLAIAGALAAGGAACVGVALTLRARKRNEENGVQ